MGEEGQELFVPSSSGVIVPNDALAAAGGRPLAGVGGAVIHMHLNIAASVLTKQQLVDEIRNGLIEVGRLTAGAIFSA